MARHCYPFRLQEVSLLWSIYIYSVSHSCSPFVQPFCIPHALSNPLIHVAAQMSECMLMNKLSHHIPYQTASAYKVHCNICSVCGAETQGGSDYLFADLPAQCHGLELGLSSVLCLLCSLSSLRLSDLYGTMYGLTVNRPYLCIYYSSQ